MLLALVSNQVDSWTANDSLMFIFNGKGGSSTSCYSLVYNSSRQFKACPFIQEVYISRYFYSFDHTIKFRNTTYPNLRICVRYSIGLIFIIKEVRTKNQTVQKILKSIYLSKDIRKENQTVPTK